MSALMCPAHDSPATPPPPNPKTPVAVVYALEGDLRFLSHHDEMRMLARAVIRAGWPIAYSLGFNPVPRMSIALPRPVGLESCCQLAVIQLTHPTPAGDLRAALADSLPRGCSITDIHSPGPARAPQPARARYEIPLEAEDVGDLAARIDRMMRRSEIWISRAGPPRRPPRKLDIRPYLDAVEHDGTTLRLSLRFIEQRSARPGEVLEELQLPATTYKHHVRLIAVEWDCALQGALAPSAQEGTTLARRYKDQEAPRQSNTPAEEEESNHGDD